MFKTILVAAACAAALLPAASAAGAPGVDLRVGSYNVASVSLDSSKAGQEPWAQRRLGVIANILDAHLDVVGVQEANQSSHFAASTPDGVNQFLDLQNGLNKAGGHYALTNTNSYNCVNPASSYKCVRQYRGASGGTRILYDTDTVELVHQGSLRYSAQSAGIPDEYLAYATLRSKATGTEFLFTSTHLSPVSASVREAEWKQLIRKVNSLKGSLPVVDVGDYNTEKYDPLAATMIPAMKHAGYGDVLNQVYRRNPTPNPRPLHTENAWINSLNRFHRDVASFGYEDARNKTGNGIDWIFASNSLVVRDYEVVVHYDPTTLQVTGTIPSDHNMIRATLELS
ncbi:MAG: endonuclease/exonuclease/phosphatase family protein [Nocardioidaceae bacterium]